MRVDFYLLEQGRPETALPLLAEKALGTGERLLVVAGDGARAEALSQALWGRRPESFIANGLAGGPADARQPVLLAPDLPEGPAANGAGLVAYADGQWREPPAGTARVLLLFGEEQRGAARDVWRMMKARSGVDLHFWQQQGAGWVKKG
ncbi:MAG TPA: DNA polymerase III subunit chi [Novosphingobium sp.]|nr:DNA polymerase III subunit chi [Novosphingobium sp.]